MKKNCFSGSADFYKRITVLHVHAFMAPFRNSKTNNTGSAAAAAAATTTTTTTTTTTMMMIMMMIYSMSI
jgi:hypothetical protein